MDKLITSSAPHIFNKRRTKNVMADVLIALLPAAVISVIFYGISALILLAVCVLGCVGMEFVYFKLMKLPNATSDLSAVVTGILLGFCLPPTFPIWMAIVGCFTSIIVVKQLFGGLGRNFANPALVGRMVLMLSFSSQMSKYPNAIDATAGPTPLTGGFPPSYKELLLGLMGGSMGEVCKLALIIGGIYLVFRKVITVTIPLSFLGSMAIMALIFGEDPLFHILAGGAILGAIFMATDYVTSPTTEKGKVIYGVCIGIITMIIRLFGNYPEGVSFAILLMNIITPYIDNVTRTKPLGGDLA